MQGFIRRRMPALPPAGDHDGAGADHHRRGGRRLARAGAEPGRALVRIPFALIPLLWFCRDRELIGSLVNRRATTVVTAAIAMVIVCLNLFLLEETLL